MSYERRSFAGAAAVTALSGDITATDTTIAIDDGTGWPTGSGGAFFAVIAPGTATEEKFLVTSRSSTSLILTDATDRGADGTTAQSHTAGDVVYLSFTAVDADEANYTAANTVGKVTTKGAILSGTSVNALAAVLPTADAQFLVSDAASPAGTRFGGLPDGVISSSAKFAVGVVDTAAIANLAVTTAKVADLAITEAKHGNASVTTPKILDANVTRAKLAADVIDGTKIEDDAIGPEHLATDAVTADAILAGTVGTDEIADGAVTIAKRTATPCCRIYNSANTTHGSNGTWVSVGFNTERYDNDTMHDPASATRITFKTAGKYLLTTCIQFAADSTGSRGVRFFLNGTTELDQSFHQAGTTVEVITVTTVYAFAVDDYVQVQAWQSSGGPLQITANPNAAPEASATWVSP